MWGAVLPSGSWSVLVGSSSAVVVLCQEAVEEPDLTVQHGCDLCLAPQADLDRDMAAQCCQNGIS